MAIAFDDDLSALMSVNDFAVAATLTPVGGSSITWRGIFDKALEEQEVDGAVAVIMRVPIFTCRSTDISSYSSTIEGASLSITGTGYIVREVTDDGTGVSELRLEKQ